MSQENLEPAQPEIQSQQQNQPRTLAKSQYRPHAWGEKVKE
jgi:hypothetical protein